MSTDGIRGAGAGVRYVKESTYGTDPGSWTITLDPLSYSGLIPSLEKAPSRGMNMGGSMVKRRSIPGRLQLPLSASHYLTYAGMGLLLTLLIGAASTTGPSGSQFTHVWDLDNDPSSFTAAIVEGEALGSLTTQRREGHGLVVTDWELVSEAHTSVVVSFNAMGQTGDASANASAVTISNVDDTVIEGFHLANLSWNGRSDPFQRVRLRVNHGVNFRDRIQEQTTARPYAVNQKTLEIEVVMEKVTTAYQVAQAAQTRADLTLTWSDPNNSNQVFIIVLENAEVESSESPGSGPGMLIETIRFSANTTSGKTGLKITLKNEDSSAEAA